MGSSKKLPDPKRIKPAFICVTLKSFRPQQGPTCPHTHTDYKVQCLLWVKEKCFLPESTPPMPVPKGHRQWSWAAELLQVPACWEHGCWSTAHGEVYVWNAQKATVIMSSLDFSTLKHRKSSLPGHPQTCEGATQNMDRVGLNSSLEGT